MDPFERWLSHFDSERAKERYRRELFWFARFSKEEPEDLLRRTPEEIEDLLLRYYRHLLDEKKAQTTAARYCMSVRGFFEKNRVRLGPLLPSMRIGDTEYERHYIPDQDEVKAMFDKMETLRDKALIAFLAQTGQRVGVLTAIKHSHIDHVDSHGVVDVSPTYLSKLNRNVNKQKVRYKFVIGEDTMGLLNELEKNSESPWVFDLSQRQMGRIVDNAAEAVGLIDPLQSRVGREMQLVHPHTFRKYWKKQVRGLLQDSDLVNYMMGHKPAYHGAYDHFADNTDLVERYKRAERNLRIIYTERTLCPRCGGKGEIQCDACSGKGLID